MEEKKSNTSLYIIIVVLCLLVLGLGGYIAYDKIISNKDTDTKETNNNSNNKTESVNTKEESTLTGKIDFNDYCPKTGDCKKDIGNINLNNKILKLSVDIKDVNTENVSGTINLGEKEIDISTLSYYGTEKRIDGFEVYQEYLILYMSSLETTKTASSNCEIRGYMMYFLDNNLKEVSGLSGYTKENPMTDFKIEDGYLYNYALTSNIPKDAVNITHTNVLIYEKTNIDKIINKNYEDSSEYISTINECQLGES